MQFEDLLAPVAKDSVNSTNSHVFIQPAAMTSSRATEAESRPKQSQDLFDVHNFDININFHGPVNGRRIDCACRVSSTFLDQSSVDLL